MVVVVAAPHRREALEACSFGIEQIKKTVPIWKKNFMMHPMQSSLRIRAASQRASGSSVTRRLAEGPDGPERPRAAAVFSLTVVFSLTFAFALTMTGCAKNPVTGHHQLMLITEEQEFAIGEGADGEVRKEYGAYLDSPALRGYVDDLGNRLARQGERPGLVFHFEILNSPVINAFALPGGFVYVTRGMLERLSSEDELAMVVGHEVGHVTARHGAARISALYALTMARWWAR